MRIDSYQISQIYGANTANKAVKKVSTSGSEVKDQISFSSVGKDLQIAKSALPNVPDVREDKVKSLKQSIDAGTYSVSGEAFADKLLAVYNEKGI